MANPFFHLVASLLAVMMLSSACSRPAPDPAPPAEAVEDGLARVGSITLYPEDLDHLLQEKYDGRTDAQTREAALRELVRRAQFAQAGLDAGLDRDPVVRAELARLLEARLKERQLVPRIQAAAEIPEPRLRELFASQAERFQSPEKRQLAVLWLDPGPDPQRESAYREKLAGAREWLLQDSDLVSHPEKGFSVLGVDHSEHHASRFKGGIIGWLEQGGGPDPWRRAVADIGFSLDEVGEVSPVTERPEGLFLVRLLDRKPAVSRPYQAVADQLAGEERNRQREALEREFAQEVESRHPVE